MPISEFVTKFGGQPVWFAEPQWPCSRGTGNPMRFIGQVAIESELFGPAAARMAYLFMTDEDEYVESTWDPNGGENAVILQPGSVTGPTKSLTKGPSLYRMVKRLFKKRLVPEPCEFAVTLTPGDDPDLPGDPERMKWDDSQGKSYLDTIKGDKIGGTPMFIQNSEFPGPGQWRLLLQLDSGTVPFSINFGDAGVGYAFLSEDFLVGKFLWQCC
jgi:uncharacterized protein YwqG